MKGGVSCVRDHDMLEETAPGAKFRLGQWHWMVIAALLVSAGLALNAWDLRSAERSSPRAVVSAYSRIPDWKSKSRNYPVAGQRALLSYRPSYRTASLYAGSVSGTRAARYAGARRLSRHSAGGSPKTRLKARLKAASES